MAPLFEGSDAFFARLAAIQNARKSIDLETYIFRFDDTGQVLARELMRKAKQGVRVRLSVDSNGLDPGERAFLHDLKAAGVEIKLYNAVPLLHLPQAYYHNHQKALVIDAGTGLDTELAVIGGRNIGGEYFSDSGGHNFIDSDLILKGPTVSEVAQNFERFWEAPLMEPLHGVRKKGAKWTVDEITTRLPAIDFSTLKTYPCNDADYAWDEPTPALKSEPGIEEQRPFAARLSDSRRVKDKLHEFVRECPGELRIEAAYFVSDEEQWKLFWDFIDRGGKLTLITNASQATDVGIVTSRFWQQRGRLEKLGADIYQHTGEYDPGIDDADGAAHPTRAIWGTHSKMMVCDLDSVALGSPNWDPRSLNFNTENILFCRRSPELAARLRAEFERRKQGDTECIANGTGDSRRHRPSINEILWAPFAWIWSRQL